MLNRSELQDLWTRNLDSQPLSAEEIDALKTFLNTADSQPSQWLSHDLYTDDLLRALYVTDQTDALDESDTSVFVEQVKRRIVGPAFPMPPIAPPPIVESVERMNQDAFCVIPSNMQGIDQANDSQSDEKHPRSLSSWVLAATAASILLALATSILLFSRSAETNDQASRDSNQLPVLRPRQGEQNEPPSSQRFADTTLSQPTPTVELVEPLVRDVVERPSPDSLLTEPADKGSEAIAADKTPGEMVPDLLASNPNKSRLANSQSTHSQSVARLIGADDAIWRDGRAPQANLHAGPMSLVSGQARLRLAKGTELELTGAVELELVDENRIALRSGFLEANVPEQATGFEVQTPAVRIVDLGTRFSVNRLPDQSSTLVKVIQGTVQTIQSSRVRNGRERKMLLTSGRTKWFSDDGRQVLDWRMVVRFGDRANDPNQLSIDGKSFDVSQGDQWVVAMRRMGSKLQEAHDQIALVPRGERFSGLLMIDEKSQKLSSAGQVDAARSILMARIQNRWTETMLRDVLPQGMPAEMESFFKGNSFPFSRGNE